MTYDHVTLTAPLSSSGNPDDGGVRRRLHPRLAAVPRLRAGRAQPPGRARMAVRAAAVLGGSLCRHVALLHESNHLFHDERQVSREAESDATQEAEEDNQIGQWQRSLEVDAGVSADESHQRHVGQVYLYELGKM